MILHRVFSEPIAIYLIGMHEIFDDDYWQAFERYVDEGLCDGNWISTLATTQANFETALDNYVVWRILIAATGIFLALL